MERTTVKFPGWFQLECGAALKDIELFYTSRGKLSHDADNVVWILHTLTGNCEPEAWWPDLVGPGKPIDPAHHHIVCANMLGSCYGSTGPGSVDPSSGEPYGLRFPLVTTRDMARAFDLLRRHLGHRSVLLGIGGSVGGQQLLEWAALAPGLFRKLCLVATNARHSAWGIAFNAAQRMALEADPSFPAEGGGAAGLAAARAIALLSYRSYDKFAETQTDHDSKLDDFRAAAYQKYQGAKLAGRFDAHAYWTLTRAMDSHDLGRGRGGIEAVLGSIDASALVLGFSSDLLFPWHEQELLARWLPRAQSLLIQTSFGHDATLAEGAAIADALAAHLDERPRRPFEQARPSLLRA